MVIEGRQPVDPPGARVDVGADGRRVVVVHQEDAMRAAVQRARRQRGRRSRPVEGLPQVQVRVEQALLARHRTPAIRGHGLRRRVAVVGVDAGDVAEPAAHDLAHAPVVTEAGPDRVRPQAVAAAARS
jgi:hypothetical protein